MMNIEEIKNSIDRQLIDGGLVRDFEEQAVRLLLFHLCIAIDIYRHMTQAEKNKAGYWYREELKNSFSLTGFLKERKRKRDKEKSPLHPSYKKESGVEEKGEKTTHTVGREIRDLTERQMAFWLELEQYIGKYDRQTVLRFFYYWAEEDKRSGKMKYEAQSSWNTKYRLAIWSRRSFEVNDQAAAVRLERAISGGKVKAVDAEQQAIAARREEDNARLEQEIAARKQGAVSYEEWVKSRGKS
jgi:hypothetical protein